MEVDKNRFILLTLLIFAFFTFCKKAPYSPRLPEYIKAEKELRKDITPEQGLDDSIANLQKKYRIELKRELEKLKNNPESWLRLIKELTDGK
uniref:Uncharacterized protein n=1 Tax=candidate division WOR-3 bacterium TaxID=2052148 RepID=A0A7C4XEL0_UNCW3